MPRILITGGTGLIGQRITKMLQAQGLSVAVLSRSPDYVRGIDAYHWDPTTQTIDPECLQDTAAIIHLAGAGVADERWTEKRKDIILKSRTQSTALLHKLLKEHPNEVRTVVCASAIGIYGNSDSEEKTEDSAFGDDFLAKVTVAWEQAIDELNEISVRVVKIRVGIVLSMDGGALAKIAKPIQWWAGAPLGSGDQYMSWIHIEDLAAMFVYAIRNEHMKGAYNGVGPNPLTNAALTAEVAKAMNKPLFLPHVPAFVLKAMLGEMATMVLGGTKVSSKKIEEAGFRYQHPEISAALLDLLH